MKDGLTVGELIVLVEALKNRVERGEVSAETPVVRSDAEWGPRPVQDIRLTKVRNNSPDDTHWEREDWNNADEPEENTWLDVVLIGNGK